MNRSDPFQKIPFTKLEGLGNDFVLIDAFFSKNPTEITSELARELLDRRWGIGGDQLLWLKPAMDSKKADCRMEIMNPDGSIAEMCGNGIRAFALYWDQHFNQKQDHYRIETLAGIRAVEMIRGEGIGPQIRVDMGPPALGAKVTGGGELLSFQGTHARFFEISLGNPHAVFFTDDLERPIPERRELKMEALGPAIESHPRFPDRTNVEFVRVTAEDALDVRVWERGAGLTLACGTGACASAVAALAAKRVLQGQEGGSIRPIRVQLPGGKLQVSWNPRDPQSSVFMQGSAREVFRGEYLLSLSKS